MITFFSKIHNKIFEIFSFIRAFFRLRPVLTRKEAKEISNEANREEVNKIVSSLQNEIEEEAKNKKYKATISGDFPLDVFSLASKIFLGRGFSTRIYRKMKPAKSTENQVYFLEISWAMEEKSAPPANNKD